jgi:farnesyl diphosphate synthase
MPDPAWQARLDAWRARVDAALAQALPSPDAPPRRLHAAMRHAVLLGGKRMRPLLAYAAGNAFGADEASLDAPAVAVELVHAYSLVHDDLPAMDDDALRRGQPTVHVAFDEGTAILAGDALQSLAFSVIADSALPDAVRAALCAELASAAAAMCAGQALDIDATGQSAAFDIESLERLHALKTGALLRAPLRMGAIVAGADAAACVALDHFADALGLAFQVRDDLLDVEGASATLGKTAGKDAAQAKPTFPALIGADASRARLATLAAEMRDALSALPVDTSALAALGRLAIERDR